MRIRRYVSVFAGVTAISLGPGLLAENAPEYVPIPGHREFTGQMIARPLQAEAWRDQGLSDAQAATRMAAARDAMADFDVLHYVELTDEYVFRVPEAMTENEISQALMATGDFQYVQPDWRVFPVGDPCTDDPLMVQQWHHDDAHFQSCEAWEYHSGDPTTSVGICDTGIRTTHEEFLENRLEGYNAVDQRWENSGGQIEDINGHGTATTGCAAANGNNGVGVSGMGWNLSHRMMRVSNDPGGGANMSVLTHAALTSIQAGDKVANVSYSGVDSSPSILTTATQIKDLGGLLTWSAGNDGRNLSAGDRDDDDLIVVGATNEADFLAGFSAYGSFVDLVAPGEGVFTTSAGSNSAYGFADGTSFSAPLTAGLIALMWSHVPEATPDEVELALKESCDDLGDAGVDNTFGYGRINALEAVIRVGAPIRLGASLLVSGQYANFDVGGCLPNQEVHVYYTIRGPGECPIPEFGVVLEIRRCHLALSGTTDSAGVRTWRVRVPGVPRPTPIAFQACQDSTGSDRTMISNILVRRIQPN